MQNLLLPILVLLLFLNWHCSQDDLADIDDSISMTDTTSTSNAKLRIQFQFDPEQERLGNLGEAKPIPDGNAGQSPDFNSMSAYFIELVPSQFTQIRDGAVIYEAETQNAEPHPNFEEAVIFEEAIVSDEGIVFLEIPIKDIAPGTYDYMRASVTYQNAAIRFNLNNLPSPLPSSLTNQVGTLASFIGFNTHINEVLVKDKSLVVNGDRQQGFWAFEPQLDAPYQDLYTQYVNASGIISGQAPQGATTVVNPLAQFGVELPFGSCIVTGAMDNTLTISGDETADINVTLSFSVNQSFEWIDTNGNEKWDIDVATGSAEQLVDMGLRGLVVKVD